MTKSSMLIEQSNVNRMIGPLMKIIHQSGAKRISVLNWDSEEVSRTVARILAAGFSRQLDKKCAVVFSEGIRTVVDDQLPYTQVTLPEFELGNTAQKVPNDFALQFIASTRLRDFGDQASPKVKIASSADAHVLVLPKNGVGRGVSDEILEYTRKYNLKWLGVVLVESGDYHA